MMALVTMTPAVLMAVVALCQQAPVRDRVAAPLVVVTGTATVSGVVLTDGDAPQPVRHATVALATGVISLPHMVVTDAEGRFTFRDLAGGSYRIAAQKTAWVPVAKPLPVAVKDGETIAGLTLRLQRGAVISGVVRVPDGGVAAGMSVQAFRTTRVDGARSASMTAEPASTDDEGRYRIFGLPPGEYVVQVRSQFLPSQAGELRQVLPSEVSWAEAALAQATLAQPALPPAPEVGPTVAYSTTYFPGTAYLSEATGVTVRAGEEHLNVDMHILRVPTAVVSGRVTGLDGAPAVSAVVTLTLPATTGQEDLIGQLIGASRVATRADGTFVLPGVPPGAYTLTVRATPPAPAGGRAAPATAEQQMAAAMASMTNLAGGLLGGVGASMSLWAQEPIQVNGQPVGPLSLQLREGLTFAGSVVFEGTTPPPGAVRVSLGAATANSGLPDVPMFRQNASIAQVTPAGTFELAGIAPGVYSLAVLAAGMRLAPTEPGTGWMVKSVRLGDRDLADDGVDMRAGSDLSGVVVTMTDAPSELSGRVLDAASEPFSAFPLVVFSANREHWGAGSRRVTAVQPSTDGSYVVAGLPAGRYYLAVLTEVDVRELASATLLESLIPSALSVTLADGERRTQDIRLAGGEPGSSVPRF